MNRAFTILEVLIAVLILSTLGLGLLKLNSQTLSLFSKIQNKFISNNYISLISDKSSFKDRKYTLYELLKNEFDLKDQKEIELLQSISISANKQKVSTIFLKDLKKEIVIYKINLYFNNSNSYLYTIQL